VAVKTKGQKVSRDPDNPERLIVESLSGPYVSSFMIVRDKQGNICKPWAREEMAKIATKRGRMEYADSMGLDSHRRWALKNAQEKAKELALQGQLF